MASAVHCQVCGDVPCDSEEEAERRAKKHGKLAGHPVTAVAMTPEAEAAIIAYALANPGCPAERDVTYPGKAERGVLVCSLDGHDGPVHYDPDGAFWIAAVKGMTRDQAETLARRLAEGLAA